MEEQRRGRSTRRRNHNKEQSRSEQIHGRPIFETNWKWKRVARAKQTGEVVQWRVSGRQLQVNLQQLGGRELGLGDEARMGHEVGQ